MIAARAPGVYSALLITLAVAGLAELLLLRLVYRVGLFLPRDGGFGAAYAGVTAVGSLAFDLASVVAFAVLGLLAVSAWRERRGTATALAALLVLGIAAAASAGDALEVLRPAVALAAAVTALALGTPAVLDALRSVPDRAATAAVMLTIAIAQSPAILGATGVALDVGVIAFRAAEVAALVAAFALGAAAMRPRPDALALIIGAIPAVALAVGLAAQPHVTGILLLWGTGVTLALPAPALVAAVYVLLVAAVMELRQPARWHRGLAIAFLAVAGVVPQSTAHVVIGVLALVLLATAEPGPVTRMTLGDAALMDGPAR